MSAAKTKAMQAKTDTKPKQDFNAIGQLGLKAQGLVNQYQGQLGNRVNPTFFAGFGKDIVALTAAVPAVITSKDGTVQLTAAQTTALDAGYRLVKGIRTTVKGFEPDKDVLLAYGIGTKVNKQVVKEVTAALIKIQDRITSQPAEATSFDLVDQDKADIAAALAAIKAADDTQEQSRAAAPLVTRDRNATARRILAGVKKIAGIGMRAFVQDATVYANFEGLITKAAT